MKQLEQLLEMWKSDCDIDRTEPGKALLDIPKLHSKYLFYFNFGALNKQFIVQLVSLQQSCQRIHR